MPTILKLDRGADYDPIDLNDQRNYSLLPDWQVRVAKRRRDQLGGRGPFEDVVEEIPLRVFSYDSAGDCLEAVERLVGALEQAYGWRRGANVDPVILQYLPMASGLSVPVEAAVLGPAEEAENLLGLPVTFNKVIQAWEVTPLVLPLLRSGLWLGAAEVEDVAAADNPSVLEVVFKAEVDALWAVVDVEMDGFAAATSISIPGGFLLFNSSTDRLVLLDQGATATGNNAYNGDVREVTASTTPASFTESIAAVYNQDVRKTAIFAKFKANAGTTWYIRPYIRDYGVETSGDVFTYEGIGTPEAVYLGMIATDSPHRVLKIEYWASTTDAAIKLSMDVILIHAADDETARVIATLDHAPSFSVGTFNASYMIEHNLLSRPKPTLRVIDNAPGSYTVAPGHKGDLVLIHKGDTVVGCRFATDGAYWCDTDGATNPVQNGLIVTRRPGYLVPR